MIEVGSLVKITTEFLDYFPSSRDLKNKIGIITFCDKSMPASIKVYYVKWLHSNRELPYILHYLEEVKVSKNVKYLI